MRKLATFAVFSAVLAAGLPGQAMAADVVTFACNAPFSIIEISASTGITLPASCAVNSSCSNCAANLLSTGFTLVNPNDIFNGSFPASFFFTRGAQQAQ
jgi:ferredoxin